MNPQLAILINQLEEKINRQGYQEAGVGNCRIFNGRERVDGYCYLTYTYHLRPSSCTVSKAQYLIQNSLCPYNFPQGFHVSHTCHNRKCIKIEHLSLEPAAINQNRKNCVSGGRCLGHGEYPLCDLNYRFVCMKTVLT